MREMKRRVAEEGEEMKTGREHGKEAKAIEGMSA